MGLSLIQRAVREVGPKAFWDGLSVEERKLLPYRWEMWARPEQLEPPGEFRFWLVQAGRGYGKTRQGAEFARSMAKRQPGSHGAFIAQTPAQARDVMVYGESGILATSPEDERPEYRKNERLLVWPLKKGQPTTAHLYSAHNFEELRGPQFSWGWLDELGKWKHPTQAFEQFNLGLRSGEHPKCIITTTPRPVAILRKLQKDPRCVVTRGSTYDNADNLAEDFLADVHAKYAGTRTGRQELQGELLEDVEGALWQRGPMLDAHRVKEYPWVRRSDDNTPLLDKYGKPTPALDAIVVGVDPSVADNKDTTEEDATTDACGIVVAGRVGWGLKAQYYVLEDATCFGSPEYWARRAVEAYFRWDADLMIPEDNNGGELVAMAILQVSHKVKVKRVHASRGKRTRAEPISLLYEQGRVHHVGTHEELEDELCTYVPGMGMASPNRLDALVWALTELSDVDNAKARARLLAG